MTGATDPDGLEEQIVERPYPLDRWGEPKLVGEKSIPKVSDIKNTLPIRRGIRAAAEAAGLENIQDEMAGRNKIAITGEDCEQNKYKIVANLAEGTLKVHVAEKEQPLQAGFGGIAMLGGRLLLRFGGASGGKLAYSIGVAGAASVVTTGLMCNLTEFFASDGFSALAGLLAASEFGPPEGAEVLTREGQIADRIGRTAREVKDAIHRVKENMTRGKQRNPDVGVDPKTGEVYPKGGDGQFGDSIGNIFDFL